MKFDAEPPMPAYLFLAGIGNSTEGHWQYMWQEELKNSHWVDHDSWLEPERVTWVNDVQVSVESVKQQDIIVIAHSLGCLAFLEWVMAFDCQRIIGAFLVCVPDTSSKKFPRKARNFRPATALKVGSIPTLIIHSGNDPYSSQLYIKACATSWDADVVNVGDLGHINVKSGVDFWPQGWNMLESFSERCQDITRVR